VIMARLNDKWRFFILLTADFFYLKVDTD